MSYNGVEIDEAGIHSGKMLSLLSFLLIHHNRKVSVTELNDMLWDDDLEITNPQNALKNLAYRLRTMLKNKFGRNDFIVTGKGSYYWNTDIEIISDVDEFEKLDKRLKRQGKIPKQELNTMLGLLHSYEGKFLQGISSKRWVISLTTYYHSLYLRCAKALAYQYEDWGEYRQIGEVCKCALLQDPLDDEIQYLFIMSLIRQNHFDLAKEQYHKASRLLYERLGIKQSHYLQKAYMEVMKNNNHINVDLDIIQTSIAEKEIEQAFYCEFGVFKEIYHLELRRMQREGFCEYVVLMTMTPKKFIDAHSEQALHMLSNEMKTLKTILCESLRSGDVVSKYSGSQYIFMLHSCNAENAKCVIERILEKYKALRKVNMVDIDYTYDELQLFDNTTLRGK